MQDLSFAIGKKMQTLNRGEQEKQSLKALKPKAKNLSSVKALKLYITEKLNDYSDSNEQFYYKVAWNLSEAQISNILERAMNANSPARYFMAAASRELK